MENIKLSEDFLKSKIEPYIKFLNSDESYERFHINNILYGTDLRQTQNDNIKFSLYNLLGVFGGNCAEMTILVNTETFEYRIKPKALYGSLNYTIPIEDANTIYSSAKVILDNELSDNDKLIFDGVVANTLYQTFYGYYKRIHPIMDKHLQSIIFGKVENDMDLL